MAVEKSCLTDAVTGGRAFVVRGQRPDHIVSALGQNAAELPPGHVYRRDIVRAEAALAAANGSPVEVIGTTRSVQVGTGRVEVRFLIGSEFSLFMANSGLERENGHVAQTARFADNHAATLSSPTSDSPDESL